MQQTIEKLIQGDPGLTGYYQQAKKYWDEILKKCPIESTKKLADEIFISQISRFEHNCGGRWLGQEIMAVVGIGQFFSRKDIDHDEQTRQAKLMYNAFEMSKCSIEVIGHARAMAKEYSIIEESEY